MESGRKHSIKKEPPVPCLSLDQLNHQWLSQRLITIPRQPHPELTGLPILEEEKILKALGASWQDSLLPVVVIIAKKPDINRRGPPTTDPLLSGVKRWTMAAPPALDLFLQTIDRRPRGGSTESHLLTEHSGRKHLAFLVEA